MWPVSAALQVYYTHFDAAFFKLPPPIRTRIESRIDETGLRLATFPRHRLRVGDYRIIYTFDAAASIIHLLAVGLSFDIIPYSVVADSLRLGNH